MLEIFEERNSGAEMLSWSQRCEKTDEQTVYVMLIYYQIICLKLMKPDIFEYAIVERR
ncbi:MAG: hypothetical protein AAF519_02040 [Bacteroidota bacterium]